MPVPDMNYPRGCSAAAVLAGRLYAIGGGSQYVEYFVPDTNKWTTVASLNQPRNNHRAAALNGCLFVMGDTRHPRTRNFEKYDPAMDTWTVIEIDYELPRIFSEMVIVGNWAHVIVARKTNPRRIGEGKRINLVTGEVNSFKLTEQRSYHLVGFPPKTAQLFLLNSAYIL